MTIADLACVRRDSIRQTLKSVLADLDDLSENLAATHVNSALEAMCSAPLDRSVEQVSR